MVWSLRGQLWRRERVEMFLGVGFLGAEMVTSGRKQFLEKNIILIFSFEKLNNYLYIYLYIVKGYILNK